MNDSLKKGDKNSVCNSLTNLGEISHIYTVVLHNTDLK